MIAEQTIALGLKSAEAGLRVCLYTLSCKLQKIIGVHQ